MREALVAGDVGVDGLLAVTTALADVERRVGRDALLIADAELAAVARGEGADAAPPACADLLRVQATVWATVLDQDGTEPQEREALRLRGVSLGRPRNGLVPVRGNLLVEAAAQMQMIFDAEGSPRVEGDLGRVQFRPANEHADADDEFIPPDDRRPAQRRHDALATALFVAAASKALPTIGGAAPTLVVSVRESDLRSGTGWAHAQGCEEPLPIGAAHHVGCAGTIQRVVLNADGRIVRIGTEERVFNRHQRRAIALRDGGCLIPGCGVPAAWCEIHHVIEHVARRTDSYGQRCAPLLVSPPIPRAPRVGHPDESGRTRSAGTPLERLIRQVAPRHEIEDTTCGSGRAANMTRGGRPPGIRSAYAGITHTYA